MLQSLVVYLIYLSLFLWLIYRYQFFGLFKDSKISSQLFSIVFLLKAMAVPIFYFVYKILYGGIDNLDSGKFYHDVKVIHHFALQDFTFYIKLMLGLQNDLPGSYDFQYCLKDTVNWDNGTVKDYLYNDNRVLIRVHTLFHFIAFDSYFAHALFSCLLSYIGIQFIYSSLKSFFFDKEVLLFLTLCFVPALWFYTGALLKEGITVFCLGLIIYRSKCFFENRNFKNFVWLLPLLFMSSLLKPYLLLFSFICFLLFFLLQSFKQLSYKTLVFVGIIGIAILVANFASNMLKHRSLMEAALKHQRLFAGVAKGGLFLGNNKHFLRLKNDSTQIKPVKYKLKFFTIKKNVSYMYWENNHELDTLICKANSDTLTQYELLYTITESKSNIQISSYQGSALQLIASSYYYSLFFPFFYHAKGLFQMLASFENLVILISLLIIVFGMISNKKEPFLPFFLVFVCLAICFLVGLATPNSGAIFRYRSPVIAFVFIAALYYLPVFKKYSGSE
jgi:hypothetical protein